MKSDATNQNWKPTLTLAKLFEEQNQFYDALAIYEIIGQTDASPDIRQRIELLQSRILSDPNQKYDARIEKLFSAEELAYLKILNHSAFENLSRVQAQIYDCTSEYDIVFDDEEPVLPTADASDDITDIMNEIESKAVKAPQEAVSEKAEPTISDLAVELIKRHGKDSKLSNLSIKDFLQLILDYNLSDKSDKE
jgi:hypothetical protein